MRKVTIWIVTLLMVFGAITGGGFGSGNAAAAESDFSGGTGSKDNPYLIGTPEQLNNVRNYVDANDYFKLTQNIDLSSYAAGAGWLPIATVGSPFYGHLDGDGFTITGLTINSGNALGLFASIGNSSTITNVTLENVSVKGLDSVSGLVGRNAGGTIENSCVTGSVTGSSTQTGGLVGLDSGGTITNSYFKGSVNGAQIVGGLVGASSGGTTIENSFVTGNVSGNSYIGGLVGTNGSGNIHTSYASASVSGRSYIGGLVGWNESGEIDNSSTTGDVNGISYVGGLVGNNGNTSTAHSGKISNSSATGNVSGGGLDLYVGGLVGYNDNGEISRSYASGTVNGAFDVGGLVGFLNFGSISNSYASGAVSGKVEIGGLVGNNGSTADGSSVGGEIINSYAMGNVNGDSSTGGLIGISRFGAPDPVNSFYDMEATGQNGSAGGVGKSTSDMRDRSIYEADAANHWDFSNTWAIDLHNGGYPYLRAIQAYLDYDGNGNTGGSVPASRSYMPGTEADIDSGTLDLEKAGFLFAGWNTNPDGSGSTVKPGDSYHITANTTLYAHWIMPSSNATLTSTIGDIAAGSITNIPYGTTLAALRAAITPAADATFEIYDADGITVATTLASGKMVIVTAQDGVTKTTYTVTVAGNSTKDITAFTLAEETGTAMIDHNSHSVTIRVARGTSLNDLIATFSLSDGAAAKVGAIDQVSGVTINDFTSPVVYEVKAADGSTQNWTVTVTVAASSENDITSFSLAGETGTIHTAAKTISIQIALGTNLERVAATFTLSDGASAKIFGIDQVSGVTENNFDGPIFYEVTAADGSMALWNIMIMWVYKLSSAATLTSTIGSVSSGGTTSESITNIPYGTTLASFKAAITPAEGATFELYDADGITVARTLATGKKVIVTAQDGTTKVMYTVTVNAQSPSTPVPSYYPVTSVGLDQTDFTLTAGGQTTVLRATINPSYATIHSVTWSSSDPKVATVDEKGVVTPIAAGTATITVTTTDQAKTATSQVKVVELDEKKLVGLDVSEKTILLKPNKSASIAVHAIYSDGTKENITHDKEVSYLSSSRSIVTVAKGIIKARNKEGSATITIGYQGKKVEIPVLISKLDVTKLEVQPTNLQVDVGQVEQIQVTATLSNKETQDVTEEVIWESSKPAVATIDPNGKLTAIAPGTAVITAAYGGKTTEATIEVSKTKRIKRLSASKQKVTIAAGKEQSIKLTARYQDDSKKVVTEQAKWSSEDESIAVVKNGTIIGQAKGKVKIQAKYQGKTVTIQVTVTE
ncbi:GLUG motif-containing protein [Brevibacillus fluminis]|nr:GLUG motif-containing protein [Brevibacillus fluminis]